MPTVLTPVWNYLQSLVTGIPTNAIRYETQLQELTRIGFGLNPDANGEEWERCVDARAFAHAPYIALLRELGGCDDNRTVDMCMEDYVAFEASGELEGAFFCEHLAFIVFGEILFPGEFGRMLRRAAAILGSGFNPQDIRETDALLDDNGDVVANPSAELFFTLDGMKHTWTFDGPAEIICADLLSKLRKITDAAPGPRRLYMIEFPDKTAADPDNAWHAALLIGATGREISDLERLVELRVDRLYAPRSLEKAGRSTRGDI